MTTAIARQAPVRRLPIAEDRDAGPARLVRMFLARRSASTRRAYETDLHDFARWLEVGSSAAALAYLVSQGPGPANELAMNYKAALQGRGLSAGTVNRRLSTLRSLMKMGRTIGLCTFGLDVESERSESYRDTRGPDIAKIRGMIGQLQVRADKGKRQGFRDLAIVRLLFNLALRRGEVVSLDVEHYDLPGQRLSIKGKGRAERQWLDLAPTPKVRAALDAWLAVRGNGGGAVFLQCDRLSQHRQGDGRLSAVSVWRMLRKFEIKPHGLRHSAITLVAERNGGDVFKTMAFSRHKSPSVVTCYIDNLENNGGKMAALLEELA